MIEYNNKKNGGKRLMQFTKTCCNCGYTFTFENSIITNLMISPKNVGAKGYFDLWHFYIEKCPECGYSSLDISNIVDKDFLKSPEFNAPIDPVLVELEECRPNKIRDYILAERYYEHIGDTLLSAKCYLQAGDLVYEEILYWNDYVYDNDLIEGDTSDTQYIKMQTFAEELYSKGTTLLKDYLENNPDDIDHQILYAGIISEGSSVEKVQGLRKLKELRENPLLSSSQKAMIDYVMSDL